MKIKRLPVPEAMNDEMVWVWSDLEMAWLAVLGWTANGFGQQWPDRYSKWCVFSDIHAPMAMLSEREGGDQ